MMIFLKVYTILYALLFFVIHGYTLYGTYKDFKENDFARTIMTALVTGFIPLLIVLLLK